MGGPGGRHVWEFEIHGNQVSALGYAVSLFPLSIYHKVVIIRTRVFGQAKEGIGTRAVEHLLVLAVSSEDSDRSLYTVDRGCV